MKYFFFTIMAISSIAYAQTDEVFFNVNSPFDEQNPVVSQDGKTLYLTIAKHPQNVGGKKDPGDIWISVKEGDSWSTPLHGGSILNNSSYNAVSGVSKDGNELYLLSHYKANGSSPSTQGISVSRRTKIGWSVPQNITIPYFLNRSETLNGFWQEGQSTFIFSAESRNTLGAEDLYVSFYRDGKWNELISLGNVINTPFQEMSPSLSSDGKKLYFASNGRKDGLGSFDIYVSERLDDTWTSWSEPVNLGAEINSDGRELYYREFSSLGYFLFTTTRNSDGYGDVRRSKDKNKDESTTEVKETVVQTPAVVVTDNKVGISGHVTNSKTGDGIPARLTFRSDSAFTASSNKEGGYSIRLKPYKLYSIEIAAAGFVNLSEKLDLQSINTTSIEMNFKLQPIEVGAVVNLKSVLFELGTTNLVNESYNELNVVVDFLKTNPKVEIELEGHTDNRGDLKKNIMLSQQRVDKIKSYLVSEGISAKRISGKGLGGAQPIAPNASEESRRLNRRVEFRIVKY